MKDALFGVLIKLCGGWGREAIREMEDGESAQEPFQLQAHCALRKIVRVHIIPVHFWEMRQRSALTRNLSFYLTVFLNVKLELIRSGKSKRFLAPPSVVAAKAEPKCLL